MQLSRLRVIINHNGHPKQVLGDVRSVLEISNEEDEHLAALSFYNVTDVRRPGTWVDIPVTEFDRITIEHRRTEDPALAEEGMVCRLRRDAKL